MSVYNLLSLQDPQSPRAYPVSSRSDYSDGGGQSGGILKRTGVYIFKVLLTK